MQAVILAAGRGRRLEPLTDRRSKAMLPVAGLPMVARVMDRLAAPGIHAWLMVARPEDAALRRFFARGRWRGRPLTIIEQAAALGTADALRCAAPSLSGPFLVAACDNLVARGVVRRLLARWRARPDLDGWLVVRRGTPAEAAHSAVVTVEGGLVRSIVEKPGPAGTGTPLLSVPIYAFSPDLLAHLEGLDPSPRGELELQSAIQSFLDAGARLAPLQVRWRRTLTTPADLLRLNLGWLEARPQRRRVPAALRGEGRRWRPPVLAEAGAEVGAGAQVGPAVYLAGGSRVGPGAHLERCVVLEGGVVWPGERLRETLVGPQGRRWSLTEGEGGG